MVQVLWIYQGGMGAVQLPDAGGILDQSILMLQALNFMGAFHAQLTDPKGEPLDDNGEVDFAEKERRAMVSWGIA